MDEWNNLATLQTLSSLMIQKSFKNWINEWMNSIKNLVMNNGQLRFDNCQIN